MGNLRSSRFQFLCAFQFLMLVQTRVSCYQYKVGDLDAWGIPSSANAHVYTNWSKNHIFKIGDSLRKFLFLVDLDFGLFLIPKNLQGWVCRSCIDLKYSHFFVIAFIVHFLIVYYLRAVFLYPPSQDSVIQVTGQSFNACNLTDPILYMNNGNSLFNITSLGEFYFTSAVPGHCEKKQKLQISVLSGNGSSAFSPSYGPSALPDSSYPTVFGSIPAANSSSPSQRAPVFLAAVMGFVSWDLIRGRM